MSEEYNTLSLSHSGQNIWNQGEKYSPTYSPQKLNTSSGAYFLIRAKKSQHSVLINSLSTVALSDFHKPTSKIKPELPEIHKRDKVEEVKFTPKRSLTPHVLDLPILAPVHPSLPSRRSTANSHSRQSISFRDKKILSKIAEDIKTLTEFISAFPDEKIKPILLFRINQFLNEHPQSLKTKHIIAAFELGNPDLIDVLLTSSSCSPIFLATGEFISSKDKINHSDNSPLCIAIKNGDQKMIKTLVTHKATLNLTYENNQNIFHFAAKNGLYSILKSIVDAWCVENDKKSLLEKLQENDTLLGNTPAHNIMQFGELKCVEFLLCHASMSVLGSENIAQNTPAAICGKRIDFNNVWFLYSFHRNKEYSHLKSNNTQLFERSKKLEEQLAITNIELANAITANQKLLHRVKEQNKEITWFNDDHCSLQYLNAALQVENLGLRCQLSSKETHLKLPEINQSGSLMGCV